MPRSLSSIAPTSAATGTPESNRHYLRVATADWHREVEAAFARFDLQTRDGLRGFLCAQAQVILPVERELQDRAVGAVLPDWPQRRRGDSLRSDLAALGSGPPSAIATVSLASFALQLGALYVLEGSRIGARLLAQHVGKAADPLPVAFLGHHAGQGAWAAFIALLDGADVDQAELACGAETVFRLFLAAARG